MHFFDRPWKPKPNYHRLLRTLNRQAAGELVTFLELFADPEIIAYFTGGPVILPSERNKDPKVMEFALEQKVEFWYTLGYDAFGQGPVLLWPNLFKKSAADSASIPRSQREWVDEISGAVTSWQLFETYSWPRPEDANYFPLEYLANHLPEGMGLVAVIPGVLEQVMWLMGYQTLAFALYDEPELVKAMFERVETILMPITESLVQMDKVIALWMGDDLGFRSGTLISPEHLRKYVFPIQRHIADCAHTHGLPFLLHSCGNLDAVMEDLITMVQIDARHSYEDTIQPVETFYRQFSDRVAVIGGVDMDLLARGSTDQVHERTRSILQACAPNGGYVLGSGNSLANYLSPDNILAMLDEGWRYNAELGS